MIECTRDNLLVAELKGKEKKETTTEGGIILSADVDDSKPAPPPGLVINVGPDVKYINPNDVENVDDVAAQMALFYRSSLHWLVYDKRAEVIFLCGWDLSIIYRFLTIKNIELTVIQQI